jgi:hypothetical protein
MSITIALIGTDGIVLAADDRMVMKTATMLNYYGDSQKLWTLKKRYGLMAANNNAGFSNWIINEITAFVENTDKSYLHKYYDTKFVDNIKNIDTYEEIIYQFARYANEAYRNFFGGFLNDITKMPDDLGLNFSLAGYNSMGQNQPQIHSLRSATLFTPSLEPGHCILGIPVVGNYYISRLRDSLFAEENGITIPKQSINVLKKLAVLIIIETAKYSKNVSDIAKMKIVREREKVEDILKPDIEAITKEVSKITCDADFMELLRSK